MATALTQSYRREAALLLQSFRNGSSSPQKPSPASVKSDAASASSSACVEPSLERAKDKKGGGSVEKSRGNLLSAAQIGRNLVLRSSAVPSPLPSHQRGERIADDTQVSADDAQAVKGPLHPDFYCAACGQLFLRPSINQIFDGDIIDAGGGDVTSNATIRVRSISRGKTRRRRAARLRARDAVQTAALRKDRGGGREWGAAGSSSGRGDHTGGSMQGHGHAVASTIQARHEQRQVDAMRKVTDGTRHHCVVYTCGSCATKTKFGGIDVAARDRRRALSANKASVSEKKRPRVVGKGREKSLEMKRKKPETNPNLMTKKETFFGDGESDFISLGPITPKAVDRSSTVHSKGDVGTKSAERSKERASGYSFKETAAHSKKNAAGQRLDQPGAKKRKKKGGKNLKGGQKGGSGNKKSKLMDFLSSLNG